MSEETEKNLSEAKEETSVPLDGQKTPETGSVSASASEPEDGNISWDDAFKEQEAADAAKDAGGANVTQDLNINTDEFDKSRPAAKAEESAPVPAAVKKPVKKLEFASFDESDKTAEPPKNLDFILDIPLTISVELGRAKMVINDMLQLGQGSVLELTKLAGEPLDVYVNGKLMARGEVVLVNDKFGVRLTDIISPVERIKKL